MRAEGRPVGNNEMVDLKIENNKDSGRFEAIVDGELAWLDYRIENGMIFLLHVEVHQEQRGRGIASRLAEAAVRFARDTSLTVVPQCPFIAMYIRRQRGEIR